MQNLCKTTMRFSPQRETWRSMARRKSSFTPFVIPRVTVWCLEPWRKERQTKSNHGYLVNYSPFKGTAWHLLCIYGPYLSLMRIKKPVLCCFLKILFSSSQVFQQLEAIKKSMFSLLWLWLLRGEIMSIFWITGKSILLTQQVESSPCLGKGLFFFPSLPLLPRPLPWNHFYKWLGLKEEWKDELAFSGAQVPP